MKILYIDMDGVVADFDFAIQQIDPTLHTGDGIDYSARAERVDALVKENPNLFHELPLIPGAENAIEKLFESGLYDIYFLSTPMWDVPESFTGKRLWLEKAFGNERVKKRLILTHNKHLNIGDYLVDDRKTNGSEKFTGYHIHFGVEYKDWDAVLEYLL